MDFLRTFVNALAGVILVNILHGAVRPVPVSLTATVVQDVGKTKVSITYSRPNTNDREIFGGLVRYSEVWRTGANRATTIAFSTEVTLGGHHVPADVYSLFTIPGVTTWTIILNHVSNQFGAFTYDATKDLVRFEIPATTGATSVETFEIGFARVADNAATIELRWADTVVAIPVSVTVANNLAQIQAEIDRDVVNGAEPTWDNYAEAARFYVEHNKDLPTAVLWFDKSCELHPEAWWLRFEQARVLAKIGWRNEAISAVHAGIAGAKATNHQGGQDAGQKLLVDLD